MTTTIMIEMNEKDHEMFVTALKQAVKEHWNGKMISTAFASIDNDHVVYEFFGGCKRMRTRTNRHGMWQILTTIANDLFWKNDKPCVLHYTNGVEYMNNDGGRADAFTQNTIVRTTVDFNGLGLETTADLGAIIFKSDMECD